MENLKYLSQICIANMNCKYLLPICIAKSSYLAKKQKIGRNIIISVILKSKFSCAKIFAKILS